MTEMTEMEICAICAWRATCQKKFSVSGKDMRCPDFVKDITIGQKEASGEEKVKGPKGSAGED